VSYIPDGSKIAYTVPQHNRKETIGIYNPKSVAQVHDVKEIK